MTRTRQVPRQRLARIITELSTPAAVNTVTPLVIGTHAGSLGWGFVVSLCSGIVPFTYILMRVKSSTITDHHVTDRTQRPAVMIFILTSLVVGLVAQLALDAPQDVVALTTAMLATLLVLAVITVAFKWKVSVHAAVAAGSVVMLAAALGSWWVILLVTLPAVMWSRVRLNDHSDKQVLAGAVIGAVVAGVAFSALR